MKNSFITSIFAIAISLCAAQDELGLRSSNFSGTNSVLLNPATSASMPFRWDVNIVSAGTFAYNRYVYVENASVISLLKNKDNIEAHPSLSNDDAGTANQDGLYYNFFDASKKMNNSVNSFVTLPSFVIRKGNSAFGLFINSRIQVSANRVDEDLDYFSVTDWEVGESIHIDKLKTAGTAWSEIGINYSQNISNSKNGRLDIGGNFKYLLGSDAFFVKSTDDIAITNLSDTIGFSNSAVKYGVASSLTDNFDSYEYKINGQGVAFDIGVNYQIASNDSRPYVFRLGASLLDIGFIHFGKNAQKHEISLDNYFDIATENYSDITSVEDLYAINSLEALNDVTQSKINDKFNLVMPMGISLQADYSITKNIFINATINRRIRSAGPQIERDNFYSLTPRFEHRWFEFGMPLVLYDDRSPRIGSWIRLGFLTIGSDHINSLLFKQKELHGSDIYMSIRINPIKKNGKNSGGEVFGGTGCATKQQKKKSRKKYGCNF